MAGRYEGLVKLVAGELLNSVGCGGPEQVATREHLVNLHAYYYRKLVKIYERLGEVQMIVDGPVFNLAAERQPHTKGEGEVMNNVCRHHPGEVDECV